MRDALGRYGTILVLGGDSDLAHATLAQLDLAGSSVVLAGRSTVPTSADAVLAAAGARVERIPLDARDVASHAELVEGVVARHGDLDLVLLAFGVLGDQALAEHDPAEALRVVETNLTGAVSLLTLVSTRMREQGHGTIVVLSSVAAVRARRSNYVYGASKAGLDAFAQGLQLAHEGTGVRVLLVRPGFVHTKMTVGRPVAPLAATADEVGRAVAAALERGADTVWVPGSLRLLSWMLRLAPRRVARGS